VVLARNHVQPREPLTGGEATRVLDNRAVVVDGAEGRNQRVSPPLVDDDLAAGVGEGREIRVRRVVATPLEETLETLHDVVKSGKARYLGASSMHAWEFSKALHLQREHGWARFVSMQDHYNLLAREEEREMLPLCADEGIGTIPWSPLARGRLARDPQAPRGRSTSDGFADLLYTEEMSDRAIIDAVATIATDRGVSRAQIALAWLRHNPVVVAPLVGASKPSHLDDAVASLEIELTNDEVWSLQVPYTPRADFQGTSDASALSGISARLGIEPASS
jgi:aryl-alcohol dehydrogenase-like predicted oxidoreductase